MEVLGRVGFSGALPVRSAGRDVGQRRNRVASFPSAGHFPRFRHDSPLGLKSQFSIQTDQDKPKFNCH